MGGEGVGVLMMKNHEGYHDPTAGKAIRRAYRRRKTSAKVRRLTYRIGEVPAFRVILVK